MSASSADSHDAAQLEVRRRLQAVKARQIALEKQRADLMEVSLRARADEQALSGEIHAVERQCEILSDELARDRQRASEIESEITAAEQSRERCGAKLEQSRRESDQAELRARALQRELESTEQRLGIAGATLAELAQTVVRLSYRVERETSGSRPPIRR